ncbi:MAG: hypothetical protein HY366_01090 [Candidatus Aenigmarchaeota archaeon]|nr:hypothetical protein [Candidatus Aenigmarchaeota archaeon]
MNDREIIAGLVAMGVLFIAGHLVLSQASLTLQVPGDPKFCTSDADCVPAECCHPTDAVNRNSAPICDNVFCTQVCAPDTLDCGQGEIRCVANKCTVVINKALP